MNHGVRLTVFGLVFTVVAGSARAEGPAESAGGFFDTLDVSVVNVDVWVKDKAGNPIQGLTEKDFQLFEDDKKVKTTNFYQFYRMAGDSSAPRRSLILYVDQLNLVAANRNRVLMELGRFLEGQMAGGELPVMVVVFDGGLKVQQDFTTDFTLLEAALIEIESQDPPPSDTRALERASTDTVRETLELLSGNTRDARLIRANLDGIFSNLRVYGEAVHGEATASVDALSSLVAALAAVPGAKSLFYVGDGLAMSPLDELVRTLHRHLSGSRGSGSESMDASEGSGFHQPGTVGTGQQPSDGVELGGQSNDSAVGRLQQTIQVFDSTASFQRLTAIANTNRVSLYPIKPPLADASTAGLGRRASETSDQALSNVRRSLDYMASATGGMAMVAGTDVAGFLERARGDFGAHYSLGFAPKNKQEGAEHLIKLKLKRRSAELRYRQNYVYKSYLSRLADRTVGALVLDWTENHHQMEIEMRGQERGGDGNYDVSLVVVIPIAKLTLVPENGVHSAKAKVIVAVLNSLGGMPPPQHLEVPLRIPEADLQAAKAQHYGAVVNLRLPRGRQKVAIGLWDETAHQGSFITESYQVGSR